jgi:hypothetical protein
MADQEKKDAPAAAAADASAAHEAVPKAVKEKAMAPWEHFKQSKNFKKYKSHNQANLTRRTGGRGG